MLSRACDSVVAQPIAAVVATVDQPLAIIEGVTPRLVLVAVGMQDPGNVGALLRSAAASGVGGVVVCSGSVDVYNPKAVRGSAGALFRVALSLGEDPASALRAMNRWGMAVLATVAEGGLEYSEVDLTAPTALVLGSEASGLPAAIEGLVDGRVTIPMSRGVESLNVAMAATVLGFEASRQRRAVQRS